MAGTVGVWLPRIGIFLNNYPKLSAWCDRFIVRPAWQATEATPEAIQAFESVVKARMGRHNPN
ncbi:MAG: hypothetical protein RMX96_34600 [Nostoc sp. ChiSLP02]|nr:hypothetical protein [Nostoc sp. DedSLP05]MDZ8097988.1 hypothetical protein [Nostoc sp. DedSLP01]MDZ8189953.1 hypothetical protein [Nostoc sp. ChiSLP02]